VEVMKLLKRNDLPLQPGTADLVFRYVDVLVFSLFCFGVHRVFFE
jgi:hypothetical protein